MIRPLSRSVPPTETMVSPSKKQPKKPAFRADESPGVTGTELFRPAPPLPESDRALLAALCEPVLSGDALTPPATREEIASRLGLDPGDVEVRLRALCATFDVNDAGRLAIEAIRRGAVG